VTSRLRIIVTGLVGLYPLGGVAWDYFQYVIGLARLGHDVYYHEDTWSWPYHPVENRYTPEGDYSATFIGISFANMRRIWKRDGIIFTFTRKVSGWPGPISTGLRGRRIFSSM